jgi:hypothetical protein
MDKYTNGFYVFVEDIGQRTNNKYITESKDSLNVIFKNYFGSELVLGEVQRPLSIFNGNLNFYVARVNVFVKPNGKKSFRHLKYPAVRISKRSKLKPAIL